MRTNPTHKRKGRVRRNDATCIRSASVEYHQQSACSIPDPHEKQENSQGREKDSTCWLISRIAMSDREVNSLNLASMSATCVSV